ncbi:MAG: hypothetical protein ABIJ17_02465 [Patescibacteria group bacterium]
MTDHQIYNNKNFKINFGINKADGMILIRFYYKSDVVLITEYCPRENKYFDYQFLPKKYNKKEMLEVTLTLNFLIKNLNRLLREYLNKNRSV